LQNGQREQRSTRHSATNRTYIMANPVGRTEERRLSVTTAGKSVNTGRGLEAINATNLSATKPPCFDKSLPPTVGCNFAFAM